MHKFYGYILRCALLLLRFRFASSRLFGSLQVASGLLEPFRVARKRLCRIILFITIPIFLFSCGSERVIVEFKTPKKFFIDDSPTDPDELNRELQYDIQQAEKERLNKQREKEKEKEKEKTEEPES